MADRQRRSGERVAVNRLEVKPQSNKSFKPNLLHYTNRLASSVRHVVGSATRVGSATQVGFAQVFGGAKRPPLRAEAQHIAVDSRASIATWNGFSIMFNYFGEITHE